MAIINYVTEIRFGVGCAAELGEVCQRLGFRRPLIVTDRGVVAAGLIGQLLELNPLSAYQVFDATPANPTEAATREGVACYHAAECDGIIAIGGGSPIDLAKAIAVSARHPGPLKDFALIEGGLARITAATVPIVAIPTTAGTGSEVGRGAIIILDDGRKVGILSPYVIPRVAICDPTLTLSLPPHLTAATGMDAVAHCIETFLAPSFNPPAEGIALDGLRRAWRNLELAFNEPSNIEARTQMLSASLQGALAFQKGLGCVHSLSHSLGGIDPRLHHGTLNAVLLPAVVGFNRGAESVIREEKLERLAQAMQLPAHLSVEQALADKAEALRLPTGLAQMGVGQELMSRIVAGALADHSHKTNPREATAEDYIQLLQASF
ncbi:iron-containing alcohol dehydrogenase [Pseudomonas rhizoryzae]|uniref:iron-containing alcohol dehydrogenase n=1 Tax=Pseudomonas rhizoryzae TaxID=2571129 RepID=UPI000737106F|nr:iron-containing alcohol dehydrogenase [Pseudomonas rhizoryzae]KTT36101.1 4-hydroxybutyrate dehydrogenase [Pseudomonas psychrotolerans]KTT77546.1 4-hydroxybutyrate dehydrogenase [Pseudomonas psychrotolerans]